MYILFLVLFFLLFWPSCVFLRCNNTVEEGCMTFSTVIMTVFYGRYCRKPQNLSLFLCAQTAGTGREKNLHSVLLSGVSVFRYKNEGMRRYLRMRIFRSGFFYRERNRPDVPDYTLLPCLTG